MGSIFSPAEYHRRIRLVESELDAHSLDALLAYSVKNDSGAVAYLCGYEPRLGLHDVAMFLFVPGRPRPCTLVTNAFWDRFEEFNWIDDIVLSSNFGCEISARIPQNARRIGIAGYRFFPAWIAETIKATRPEVMVVDATDLLKKVAQVKSEAEIELLRRCVAMSDLAGTAFLENVREGACERDLRVYVEKALLDAGADGPSFGVQVYSGDQVAVGIGFETARILKRGEQVQLDCGAHFCRYRSDLSRVTTIGRPQPEVERTMEITAQMYDAMLAAISPGRRIADVARAAMEVARENKMENYLYRSVNHPVGFVGHGIGCWVHECPEISPNAEGVLEPGMAIVPEPILVRPGIGGAKIEDVVLVTPNGVERLSALDPRTWPT